MTLLGGDAAALFGEIMGPLYVAATLRRTATTYDDRGGQTRTGSNADCLVQVDNVTESMRAADGFAATDRSLFFLASSLDAKPSSDDQVTVTEGPHAGSRWRVANPIDSDPAGAYWRARAVSLEGET